MLRAAFTVTYWLLERGRGHTVVHTRPGHEGDERMVPVIDRLGRVLRSYVDVARGPAYFPLWLSQLVSSFGDTLHYIALVVLVFELTGRGAAVAVLVAAEIVPVLLLGPVAGVVIDRFSRKAVLIGSDLWRAALVASLVWPQGAWHAYAVAVGDLPGMGRDGETDDEQRRDHEGRRVQGEGSIGADEGDDATGDR